MVLNILKIYTLLAISRVKDSKYQINVNCISDLNYNQDRKQEPEIFMMMLCKSAALQGIKLFMVNRQIA